MGAKFLSLLVKMIKAKEKTQHFLQTPKKLEEEVLNLNLLKQQKSHNH